MTTPPKPPKPSRAMLQAQATRRIQAALEQAQAAQPRIPGAIPLPPPPTQPAAEKPAGTYVPPLEPRLRTRVKPERKPQDPVDVTSVDPAVYRAVAKDLAFDGRSLGRLPRNKRRRHGMSLSCSAEEYEIIMGHCDSLGVSFSEWARKTLFRAIGREVPARPKRGR